MMSPNGKLLNEIVNDVKRKAKKKSLKLTFKSQCFQWNKAQTHTIAMKHPISDEIIGLRSIYMQLTGIVSHLFFFFFLSAVARANFFLSNQFSYICE